MQRYTIKQICQKTGVNPSTLRTWERRYQLVVPQRTDSGRRFYSDSELKRIQLLARLVVAGHSIGHLKGLNDKELAEQVLHKQNFTIEADQSEPDASSQDEEWGHVSQVLEKILESLHNFDLSGVSKLLKKCVKRLSTRDLVLQIISPLLNDIGVRVQQGIISIAQEHALSSLIKFELIGVLNDLKVKEMYKAPKIAIATPEGDFHEFGILISSILCADQGWKVYYLGPNLPLTALNHILEGVEIDVVLIGTIHPVVFEKEKFMSEYMTLLNTYPKIKFWLGGAQTASLKPFQEYSQFKILNSFRSLEAALLEKEAA